VDFHHICDPGSSDSIAVRVNAFQYSINTVFFITFRALREIGKPQQSGSSEKYCHYRFFDPILSDTFGTTSSRAPRHCRRVRVELEPALLFGHNVREVLALLISQRL
jgi:hypothetical protein